jgi:hypothetical protein
LKVPHIVLTNLYYQNGVNVEARMGPNQNAEGSGNVSLGTRNIAQGGEWAVDSGSFDVFWRRDEDPDHPNGTMTTWEDVSSANGDQTIDVGTTV